MNKHKNVKPFECNYENCGKAFIRKDCLKNHIKNIHEKERPPEGTVFKCDYCVFETKSEPHYKAHNTRFHTDRSQFALKCDFEGCPKMFKMKVSLRSSFYDINKTQSTLVIGPDVSSPDQNKR